MALYNWKDFAKKVLSISAAIWNDNSLFFYLATFLFLMGSLPLLLYNKVYFFLLLKKWHHPLADGVVPFLTWIGHGITYGCFILTLILFHGRCRTILIMGGSFIAMSIIVQFLKRICYAHIVRPLALVPLETTNLHIVENVELLTELSFPSGHAACIFTLISVIQLLSNHKKKIYTLLLLILGLLVSYSRIYLCQHFYTDVYGGALIGTASSFVAYITFTFFYTPPWLKHSAYSLLKYYGKKWWHTQ